jgi:nicotinamide phosphoribosyltransferase
MNSLISNGFSIDNIAFGMGGMLLQAPQRDDQKFAMKCSAVQINGVWRDVFKDPITDAGKKSKSGRLALVKEEPKSGRTFSTVRIEELNGRENILRPVYEPGKLLVDDKFSTIRERSNNHDF